MAKSPVFGPAWRADRRCLIPAWEFDEPCYETGRNQWWLFRRKDQTPWGIAGLWSEWSDPETGEIVPNYTMITRNVNDHPLMSRMHAPELDDEGKPLPLEQQDKRSIIPLDPSVWGTWLWGTKDEAQALFKLPAAEDFDAGPEPTIPRLPPAPHSIRKQLPSDPPQGGLF